MARKNKGRFGKGKPEIPETDEFVSGAQRFFDYLKPHAARLAVALLVAGTILGGVLGFQWWEQRKEIRATTSYAQVVEILRRSIEDEENDKETLDPDKPSYASEKLRDEAALNALDLLQTDHAGTDVEHHAKFLRGTLLYKLARYQESVEVFRNYTGPSIMQVQAREAIGYGLEAAALAQEDPEKRGQGLQQALEAFRAMQPDVAGYRHDYALYHQARVLTLLSKKDEAVELFRQIVGLEPESSLIDEAEQRLIALGVAAE